VSPFDTVVVASASVVRADDFNRLSVFVCGTGVVTVDGAVTGAPLGGVPVAVAVFTICAASTLAWVTT
jgi:hypothetical protein